MAVLKARSRLSSTVAQPTESVSPTPEVSQPHATAHHSRHEHRQTHQPRVSLSLTWLAKWWPFLLMGIVGYSSVLFIIKNWYPSDIANWGGVSLGYIPFQVAVFLGTLGFSTLLFRRIRRGLLFTLALQVLLILKLQLVVLTPILLIFILVFFGILEACASLLTTISFRRKKSH